MDARHIETHGLVACEEHGYQSYWWACTCGDEGGPFPTYNHAWDSWVDHPVTRARERRHAV